MPQIFPSFAAAPHGARAPLAPWLAALAAASLLLVASAARAESLTRVTSFGTNPGNLLMYKYVPDGAPASAPLVVVLHGCTQTAQVYADASGWHKFARLWKFHLVFAEQHSDNNSNRCFNWFVPGDTARGGGEALSIKQMVDRMKADHSIDSQRVFVTGLSAGAAMTNVVLAAYPDVFRGGAPIAGIPYRCAGDVAEAFSCMNPGKDRTPRAWGDLVRGASSHSGKWPRVTIWHGDRDGTVVPMNAVETVEQWTNVHGIDAVPDVEDTVAGYPRKIYKDSLGEPRVELFMITGMGHATPLDPGSAESQCGTPTSYMVDANICSSYWIGRFWGLDASDRTPPTVAITSPADGATVSGSVAIAASASDDVGVARVEFYVDGRLLDTVTSSPWSTTWNSGSAANGEHVLLAKAHDAAGNVGTSAQVEVTVTGGVEDTTPPTVSLTFPREGDTLHGTVTLSADARDDVGVRRVEFFIDGASIGTGTPSLEAGPWTLSWNTSAATDGPHTVEARAVDARGNLGRSGVVNVVVDQTVRSLDETFSDRDGSGDAFDSAGWTGGFVAHADNHTDAPAGSRSMHGAASSGVNCATGTKWKALSRQVTLGPNPRLRYARKLDLRAAVNTSTWAAFRVYVDSTVVDSRTVTYASYTDADWVVRDGIDLSGFAGRTVTLKVEVSASSNVCIEVAARAWVDDFTIADPRADTDTKPPTTKVTSPAAGATVTGAVDVSASASDDVGVNKVELYVDGGLAGSDPAAPYVFKWDSTAVANGSHTLQSKAYDAAGNVGASSVVTVNVSNAGGGPTTVSFTSVAADDGYVKAFADGSSAEVGAYESSYGLAIGRGTDGKLNRALLSFNTSSIPDGATITKAYVRITRRSGSGDPWGDPAGNTLVIDARTGCFGSGCGMSASDWGATATASAVANVVRFTSGAQNSGDWSGAGLAAIDKAGKTQVRLRFSANQTSTNYLWIGSGTDATLVVEYR